MKLQKGTRESAAGIIQINIPSIVVKKGIKMYYCDISQELLISFKTGK
jgi:hypothetical protein